MNLATCFFFVLLLKAKHATETTEQSGKQRASDGGGRERGRDGQRGTQRSEGDVDGSSSLLLAVCQV